MWDAFVAACWSDEKCERGGKCEDGVGEVQAAVPHDELLRGGQAHYVCVEVWENGGRKWGKRQTKWVVGGWWVVGSGQWAVGSGK